MNFTVSNVKKINIEDFANCRAVQFDLETNRGKDTFIEWLNGNEVEKSDCHLYHHEMDKLEDLFDLSEKPGLMPSWDYLPHREILVEVERQLQNIK